MPLNESWDGRFAADPSTDGAAIVARIVSERYLGPAKACECVGEISRFHDDDDKMPHSIAGERDILS